MKIPHGAFAGVRFDSRESRRAALLVQLAQPKWNANEATRLADLLVELSGESNDGQILESALHLLENRGRAGVDTTRFVLSLREKLAANQFPDLPEIVRLLNEGMDARTSQLGGNKIWTELGLPQLTLTDPPE